MQFAGNGFDFRRAVVVRGVHVKNRVQALLILDLSEKRCGNEGEGKMRSAVSGGVCCFVVAFLAKMKGEREGEGSDGDDLAHPPRARH
ncbi:hypothetical protein HAX54_034342 [Datura stramonium]|uniref:Uncharacterized protein n=1 Tax=Datura stramonium TaxID=4076 RepID=A0ABS8SE68_DATST|nr:hypothetical protein [Datura stramonium]